jgi:hypothetical protein
MAGKAHGPRVGEGKENDQTKFACLVAAILATSMIDSDSPCPDKVFKVYGNLVRMTGNQSPGF